MKKVRTMYRPRFDFGNNTEPDRNQTATLRELLDEINFERENPAYGKLEYKKQRGEKNLHLKDLETTLNFVREVSGLTLRSTKEVLDLKALKTIKLLHKCSKKSDTHFFRVIGPPGPKSLSSIDLLTSPPTEETLDIKKDINLILGQLEKEIDQEEIAKINSICDHEALQIEYRHNINNSIDNILLKHIHHKDDLLGLADVFFSNETKRFLKSVEPVDRESRAHVATYTHLKLLEFKHRIYLELITKLSIPNDRVRTNKAPGFDRICRELSKFRNKNILPHTNHLAIGDVRHLCDNYATEISKLVSDATGFKYTKRDLTSDQARARFILYMYLVRIGIPQEKHKNALGIIHVVSAFCSLVHQRKIRTRLIKYSRKYSSTPTMAVSHPVEEKAPKASSPQKLLDACINRTSKHIPFTVNLIYTERMIWYGTVFSGTKERYDNHLKFAISQTNLIQCICASNNYTKIAEILSSYRSVMENKALEFIKAHNKEDTHYDWVDLN